MLSIIEFEKGKKSCLGQRAWEIHGHSDLPKMWRKEGIPKKSNLQRMLQQRLPDFQENAR